MLKISIAMCTYNGSAYLTSQLESILLQSNQPFELIVCDDGSNDETNEILIDFSKRSKFPIIIHYNEKNLGSTKNFEKAINLCNGDVIALADQDDIWLPHKLEKIAEIFNLSSEIGLVFSNGDVINSKNKKVGFTLWESFRFTPDEQAKIEGCDAFSTLLGHSLVTGATLAFRTHLRDKFSPIPSTWVHDAWIAQISSIYVKLKPISLSLIQYRIHENQQIGVGNKKNIYSKLMSLGDNDDLKSYLSQSVTLLKYITSNKNNECNMSKYTTVINMRISHLKTRIRAQDLFVVKRMVLITNEIFNKNYFRFSNGFVSFFKDIIRSQRVNK